ncbi:MAG TPA: formate dehydrogenase subunit delta [Burkholderiales bacterium]|jgi:formate dehydrogenase subunit delta|nr:formate dehydrogenase subunit delta [Burkholderiales bacterium]
MNVQRLVRMANDIGNFFKAEPDHAQAVDGVATHIRRFWDPRMRKEILAHLDGGGDGLSDLAKEAIGRLR